MTTLPWYSDQEVDSLCEGLTLNAAKIRHLKSLGLTVAKKPNGRPLVMRSHAERVLSGMKTIELENEGPQPTVRGPNRTGLILQFGGKAA